MVLLLFACFQEAKEAPTGADLLADYSSSYCDVHVQSDCGIALASCGAPAMVFQDTDACLEANRNAAEGCENLEQAFLGSADIVQACIDTLSNAASSCSEEDLCPNGATIFEEGDCAEVLALISDCG
jgi:hypothetical protein